MAVKMRGSENLKKILKFNEDSKSVLFKSIIIYNILVGGIYLFYNRSLVQFALCTLVEVFSILMLAKICKPIFTKENGSIKLVSVVSLNSKGVVSFFFDVLFWGMLCKALMAISWKWIFGYLGILISFLSEFIYKPYKKLKSA